EALAAALEAWIAADASLAALPPKFGFAVGAADDPHPLPGDISSLPLMGRDSSPEASRVGKWGSSGEPAAWPILPHPGPLRGRPLPIKGREEALWCMRLGGYEATTAD